MDATDDAAVFEWVVGRGATYRLTARHERAGAVRVEASV
jgi:hypothetical protein